MDLHNLISSAKQTVTDNSAEILTAGAVVGVVGTAYLTARGTVKAIRLIDHDEGLVGTAGSQTQRLKERTKIAWRCYIPAAGAAGGTIACILFASQEYNKRTAAAVAAYTVADKAYTEYREKVTQELGKNKDQKVNDAVATDKVNATPPSSQIVVGDGDIMCCDLTTMRYFVSTKEKLLHAQNLVNHEAMQMRHVTYDDFYDMIGVIPGEITSGLGWDFERLMELEFTSVLTPEGKPCLAFRFNYIKPL